ncbi:hypothetical protein SAMN04487983_101341 [Streptomyces sp. yr375]|uniref:hypothetical protein n=1 Tax=Streptomyces sp. yr375 TaxID=1761906 RepID=UPI0008D73BEF|nr:hypothetical protein [Streptomyces sp. yr375]SER23750.1 hypothetical protein SAMN04487983_101341 [Streptomyces sp. yr375]
MFRGATARTLISILAAVLLTLPFFAPTSPFAQAHTTRQAEAKAQPGIKLSGKAKRDELVALRDCDHSDDPTGPLRTREGHRAATTAPVATAPQEPERALLAEDPAAAHQPARPGDSHHRLSRSSTAHSPAALQVFRC